VVIMVTVVVIIMVVFMKNECVSSCSKTEEWVGVFSVVFKRELIKSLCKQFVQTCKQRLCKKVYLNIANLILT